MSIKIHPLSTGVANQIAAGEVIERPASVIKELLENALDANANHISVVLNYGGLNAMIVSDNGEGIYADDLPFAVMPHATSKIRLLSDLTLIKTMGFRGEALASIASVSKLSIQSRPQDQDSAMQISVNGEEVSLTPCARNPGTTVSVQDLFFNAPVRKRFLKSERTEFLVIDKLVRCFALSSPALSLDFYHNDQAILVLPKGLNKQTQIQRVRKVLGKAFVDASIEINVVLGGIHLSGWITQPDYARSQQDRMWVYVNRRMVNDKLLNHAIKQAYGEKLYPGRYPACLLYLEIDTQEVDVNVHPTKHELRFHNPRLVHDVLRSAIAEALNITKESLPSQADLPHFSPAPLVKSFKPVKPFTLNNPMWTLNQDYLFILKEQQTYILDIKQLSQDELLARLRQQSLPLASRPLYVPISVFMPKDGEVGLEQHFELLAQIGLSVSWAGEKRLLVRSLPIDVPQLKIQAFIDVCLAKSALTLDELMILLVTHHGVNAQMASEAEKQNWMTFIETCPPEMQRKYVRLLTAEHCQHVFND